MSPCERPAAILTRAEIRMPSRQIHALAADSRSCDGWVFEDRGCLPRVVCFVEPVAAWLRPDVRVKELRWLVKANTLSAHGLAGYFVFVGLVVNVLVVALLLL